MPWQIEDVDRFKKGLSLKGKRKWVAIANSTLTRCQKNGGSDCEAMAIKIANGFVKENEMKTQEQEEKAEFYRFRQKDPKEYVRFRVQDAKPGIRLVIGFKRDGGSETQSVLFDKEKFTVIQAKKWLEDHDMKTTGMEENMNKSRNFHDITQMDMLEVIEDEKDPKKREFVVTFLKEGPGNKLHKNYYKRSALNSAKKLLESRRKMFFNHADNIDNPNRDLRDWASSVQEAWVEESASNVFLKGRVKVYDEWLWSRGKEAASELALSIEGKGIGSGEKIKVDGEEFNAIEKIAFLNGVNWVPYPGNASMGVELVEENKSKEDAEMTFEELKEKFALMTDDEKKEFLKENQPSSDRDESHDEKSKIEIKKLAEQIKTMESRTTKTSEDTEKVKSENIALANKLEAYEIKERQNAKKELIESLLAKSKLKDEHKTEAFRSILLALAERKEGEKIVTIADQAKVLIDDREKICIAEKADVNSPGSGSGGKELSEREQQDQFNKNIFGIDTSLPIEKKKGDGTEDE